MLSGDAWWIGALFVLAAVAAVMLCIGYRTRVATALSWFLLLSLQLRNPAVLNLGDHLLLMLLFWGMWIPWGSTWSVDSRRRPRLKPGTQVLSVASLGLMLQIAAVYWFSYFFKTDPVWKDGEAIYYVLQLERFATGIGAWILTWPQGMLQAMGKGVLYLEVFGPMLLFVPWKPAFFRIVAIGLFWAFHAGLGLSIAIGLFPLVCMVAWMMLLPGSWSA